MPASSPAVGAHLASVSIADQLGTWEVLPALRDLRGVHSSTLNRLVLRSCRRALTTAGDDDGRTEELARLEPVVRRSTWTTPDLAFAHQVGLLTTASTEKGYLDHLIGCLAQLASPEPPRLRVSGGEARRDWLGYALGQVASPRSRTRVLESSPEDEVTLELALEQLEHAWPEMGAAVQGLVREIVWWQAAEDGAPESSATLAEAFGAVFCARGGNVVDVIETLVRETTHLDLIMREAVDPLCAEDGRADDGRVSSPFHGRSRRLRDALRNAVVSARVQVALERCADWVAGRQSDECATRRQAAASALVESLGILNTTSEWTPAGADLIASLNDHYARKGAHAVHRPDKRKERA